MVRVRRIVGREQRQCPTCEIVAWFDVYESWERDSKRFLVRRNLRKVARCDVCEYRIVLARS